MLQINFIIISKVNVPEKNNINRKIRRKYSVSQENERGMIYPSAQNEEPVLIEEDNIEVHHHQLFQAHSQHKHEPVGRH